MAWADKTLSTSASLAKIESEINDLTSSDWSDKISTAKTMIGARLENALSERRITVDEQGGDILLDVIVDPDVTFGLASDFQTLFLIYNDLGFGSGDDKYEEKKKFYSDMFEQQFAEDEKRMKFDLNLDDTTDVYRTNWNQRLQR